MDISVFLKEHLTQAIAGLLAIVASVAIVYVLKKHPARFGFETKPDPKVYLLALVPLIVAGWVFLKIGKDGLSYPTGICVHQNTLIVNGIVITTDTNERGEDTFEEEHEKTLLFDKSTGKKIASIGAFSPLYCAGNVVLGSASGGYQSVDLTTGAVLREISENDIKARASTYAGEKIYTVEFKPGETQFAIRTVKDKNYVYDPILEKEVSPETHTPFYQGRSNDKFKSTKINLFLAEVLGKNKNGITLVLSYDDLEKSSFLISAISPEGELLWTKRDAEISTSLAGNDFAGDATTRNTVLDEHSFYFVNNQYVVCGSLENGGLKWMQEI